MNVRYENIHGNSIYEILTNEENVSPILKRCDHCQRDMSHAEVDSFYELPDVLVISLQRWRQDGETITKDCREVEPSTLLQFDDAAYSLNAVVTHFGRHVYEGNIDFTCDANFITISFLFEIRPNFSSNSSNLSLFSVFSRNLLTK